MSAAFTQRPFTFLGWGPNYVQPEPVQVLSNWASVVLEDQP